MLTHMSRLGRDVRFSPAILAALVVVILAAVTGCNRAESEPAPRSSSSATTACPDRLGPAVESSEGLKPANATDFASAIDLPSTYPLSCAFGSPSDGLAFYVLDGGALLDELQGELDANDLTVSRDDDGQLSYETSGTTVTITEEPFTDASRPFGDLFSNDVGRLDVVMVRVG